MSVQPSNVDIGLRLPLRGARLIEASAGTGKTFTLATLVLRLLLECGASMSQMLVVTFTRAATQELRHRLRARLRLARRLLETPETLPQGEAAITAAVLRAAIERDGESLVRQRIEAALLQLDEATVSTIHGFCHRALREFGFRAGLLAELAVIDDAADVWREVADELWRAAANTADAQSGERHALLAALWQTPEALAEDLPALCDPLRIAYPQRQESDAARALHALRDAAMLRFETMMSRRGESSQDQLIERIWRASETPEFAAALAERWPLMLIDEFQDTDPRQWDIFRRMYAAGDAEQRWMCLIGDPKQAIYRFRGGDLATYLRARAYVIEQVAAERSDDSAQAIARLDANYRSTPSVLGAIETVFAANPLPFVDATIDFHPLSAASPARDGDLGIAGHASPGMTLHWLPALPHDPGASSRSAAARGIRTKDQEFALMREAAVQTIANLLANGRLRAVGGERALRPADIAVLTDTNDQAAAMQRALVRIGIAAATASGASVFAGETAEDLHVLLASLTEPAETGRFRAALATRLLGWRADRIAALDDDAIRSEDMLARFAAAADLWRARGPLPALLPFIADAAPRWLAETAGARRLTDALHLLELLQAESAARTGLAEQLTWFAQQCARATNDDARQLRLESDTGTVQIVTTHKSKGLEYPVVVLPFAAWRSERAVRGLVRDDFVDALGRPARAWRCKGILEPMDADAIDAQVEREAQAEAQRKLYVAMTRARHALHVVWSRNDAVETTALHWLLHAGEKTGRKRDTLDHAGMRSRIERLAAASGGGIVVEAYDPEAMLRYAAASSAIETPVVPPARVATRRFSTDLRLHSFSSLHARGGSDGDALRGADDEAVALPEEELDAISLGGTAFGNAVHAVLETVDGREWRSLMPAEHDSPPEGVLVIENVSLADRKLIRRALLRNGLKSGEVEINQVARLVRRALNAMLPGDVRLWALPQTQQVREMAFHFRLRPTRIDAVHALLQAHGYPRARRPAQATLDGLMQGYIDLVYRDAAGRHYVLDYKTNRLPAYDPESLRRAIRAQDYDLQYLIYLVALRRWLKLRRGACYDDNKDIGGAVYLFLRGVDVHARGEIDAEVPRAGVHIDRVSPSLLSALDDLFDGAAPGNASGGAG